MSSIIKIGLFDLKMLLKDPGALFQMIGFPILFIFVFGMAFGSDNTSFTRTPVIVENNDTGGLGQIVIDLLPEDDVKVLTADTAGENASKLHRLILPATFTTDLTENPPASAELHVPDQSSFMKTEALKIAFIRAQIKTLATVCRSKPEGPEVWNQAEFMTRWDTLINEPEIIQTVTEVATRREAPPTGFEHQVPGNIVMFVLMVLLVNSGVQLVSERRDGSFRRLLASPVTSRQVIIGKTLGRLLPAILQVILLFITGVLLFDLDLTGTLPQLALLSAAYCFCAAAMGLTLGMWLKDRQHVVAVGVPVTLALAALGGCWWPIEIVGPFMQKLAMLLPTGWAMRGYHEIISFGYGVNSIIDNVMLLLITGICFIIIASQRVHSCR